MNQKSTPGYFLQFGMLLGLVGAFMIASALVMVVMGSVVLNVPLTGVVDALNDPKHANASRLLNTVAAGIIFFIPAVLFAIIIGKRPLAYLGFSRTISRKQVMLVGVLTIGSMVLSGALGALNEKIPLPADLYAQFRKMEDLYKNAMLVMATMHNFGDYIIALLVIAAAPALFEEVFFRGTLQQLMTGWTKNKWAGIIITSVLFSAFHMSYFGFLPRAALGVVLGIVFYNSRNIWLCILLHFLNNAIVVTQLYIVSSQGKEIDKTFDENMPMWWGIIGIAFLVLAFRAFNKETRRVLAPVAQPMDNETARNDL